MSGRKSEDQDLYFLAGIEAASAHQLQNASIEPHYKEINEPTCGCENVEPIISRSVKKKGGDFQISF